MIRKFSKLFTKMESFQAQDLIGKVYLCGSFNEGMCSLHFNQGEAPYMSLESYSGGKLADGSPYPSKKFMTECNYDQATRTFTGKKDWSSNPLQDGTYVQDMKLVFNEDFS